MSESSIRVEVAYASAERQVLLEVELPVHSTVADAIDRSGILGSFPEIDLESINIGIFSRKTNLDHTLSNGDRVEIYRPLLVDPKEARRLRAEAKQRTGVEAKKRKRR